MADWTWRCDEVASLVADRADLEVLRAKLPDWRRRAYDAMVADSSRRRSIAAWLNLERLLASRGVEAGGLTVRSGAFGKPAFDPSVGIDFNLSHSDGRVLAVVADSPVGCDIERIAPVRPGVPELCLTDAERAHLGSFRSGPVRDREFCRLWVRKESFVKALGRGMDRDLRSFEVLEDSVESVWRLHEVPCGDGYLGCVCVHDG